MGYEGFSRPLHPLRMHPVSGNRGEFLFLLFFCSSVLFLMHGRKSNETSLRALSPATNRYAEFSLDE